MSAKFEDIRFTVKPEQLQVAAERFLSVHAVAIAVGGEIPGGYYDAELHLVKARVEGGAEDAWYYVEAVVPTDLAVYDILLSDDDRGEAESRVLVTLDLKGAKPAAICHSRHLLKTRSPLHDILAIKYGE
ncbi:MAG: hypothetical protein ABI397_01070 [Candidatus Saccharimonas sp.]